MLVEERPFSRRNYAGDEGRAAYETLRTRGEVVDPDDLLDAVEAAVGRTLPATADGSGAPAGPDKG